METKRREGLTGGGRKTGSGNLPSRIVVGFDLCGILWHDCVNRKAAVMESLCIDERITMRTTLTLLQ